jgi:hypothetical protein
LTHTSIGHVDLDRQRGAAGAFNLVGHRLQTGLAAGQQRHPVTSGGESADGGSADPAGGPGDGNHPAVTVCHDTHHLPLDVADEPARRSTNERAGRPTSTASGSLRPPGLTQPRTRSTIRTNSPKKLTPRRPRTVGAQIPNTYAAPPDLGGALRPAGQRLGHHPQVGDEPGEGLVTVVGAQHR